MRDGSLGLCAPWFVAALIAVPAVATDCPAAGKPAAAAKSTGAAARPKEKAASAAPSKPAATEKKTDAPTTDATAKPPTEAPRELDADTQADLAACPSPRAPGQKFAADSGSRPELVIGRRRVFDRVRGYVCIPGYAISGKPVTQAQYESVIGVRPHGRDYAPGRPVFVSFLQAVHYCNTVSLRERLTPCYEVRLDKKGKETVAWPGRTACTGYRLPAAEEAAAYDRGTESEWTWFSSTLPLGQLDARTDAPRGFYLARSTPTAPANANAGTNRHAKR
ncbi:MAG TPA: hypothetical protein PKI03_40200 [Pseudomonadota bacterium]|nr:hypothetical protein [Pseudomonadota bacterium]